MDTHTAKRPTIGYLTPTIQNSTALSFWTGIVDAAQQHDLNLLCMVGGRVHDHAGFAGQGNILYDLLATVPVDGIISWASTLCSALTPDEVAAFHQPYQTLPMVTLSLPVGTCPMIGINNLQGMRDLMEHLVVGHGYRRIAFMRGPENHQYAQERYQVYCEVLQAHGLPVNPQLITPPGNWSSTTAFQAVQILFDERRLRPKLDIEAIVAVNDKFALLAAQTLQARGVRIPHDLAIVGVNNSPEGACHTPPLTSVTLPFYEQGYAAVETLEKILQGAEVPALLELPSRMIIRQSCGCLDPSVKNAVCPEREIPPAPTEHAASPKHAAVARLCDSLRTDLCEETNGAFLTILQDLTGEAIADGHPILVWQEHISAIRQDLLPQLSDTLARLRIENLVNQARVLIGEAAQRAQAYQRVQEAQQARTLRELSQTLITTFDVSALLEIIGMRLPLLGIPSCYLAVFEVSEPYQYPQPPPEWSRLLLAYTDTRRVLIEHGGRRFPTRQLLPDGIVPEERAAQLVVKPLYFREEQIGVILFEIGPRDGSLYNALSREISSALQGALLVQRVQDHAAELKQAHTALSKAYAEVDQRVQERTAELHRINRLLQEEIQKHQESAASLRISEQQYRLLAEHVNDGIVIVQEQRVVFANTAFAAMMDIPLGQILQRDVLDLFPESSGFLTGNHLEQHDWGQSSRHGPVEITIADRRTRWLEVNQNAIVWNNHPALLLTVQDVTERKVREQRLEAERTRLQDENLALKSAITDRYRFGELIGKSPAMQRVYELIVSAATSAINVLIVGESGTGKELIAHTIHQVSARKMRPFVPVNCASIPESLFEREFFGHQKGAFTGADRDQPGVFDRAHQGVLFLDEVTELSPGAQAKLLRVLQDGEYTPLGSSHSKRADVMIVAATNKDYQALLKQGILRKDFFYRICVIEIQSPPLRERKDDLPLLIDHLLTYYQRRQAEGRGALPDDLPNNQMLLPATFVRAMYAYDWPGNVRELQNVLQRYLATRDLPIVLSLLSMSGANRGIEETVGQLLAETLAVTEKRLIADALERTHYQMNKTAKLLGISRITLYRKIKIYRLWPLDEQDSYRSEH